MKTPENITLYQHAIATYWLDNDGICHIMAKDTPRTLELIVDNISFFKRTFHNKKMCVLANATEASPLDKDGRDYMASEIKNIYKALVIVSDSLEGRRIANNFIISQILDPGAVPMKMFTDEEEAKEWLKQYL